jgi:hypothetical protein
VDDGCGASGYTGVTVYPGYSCGGGYIYSYYPNPAKDKLTVEVFDQPDGKPLDVGFTIPFMTYIYDGRQKELMHAASNANKAVFNIDGLKKGIYFIKIVNSKQTISARTR